MIADRPLPGPETEQAEVTACSRSRFAARGLWIALLIALLALVAVAAAVRLQPLHGGVDGRLTIDEARLVLVARGVGETGLPTLPTDRLYTRALLVSYLVAGSFALLGQSDFAARIPIASLGVLLVPAAFLLARRLAGPAAGLAVAAFVALAEPLIDWSRQAWMPMPFLVLFCLTLYCWYRGFVQYQARWQVLGGLALLLAVLTYEFAVLMVAGLGLFLGLDIVRRRWDWYHGRPTLVTFGIVGLGLALFWSMALVLRSGTVSGPLGEVSWWFTPDLTRLEALDFYYDVVLGPYALLVAAALFGFIPLLHAQPRGALFLGLLAALAVFVPSFLLQVKQTDRYGLPALLLLVILAAGGTVATLRLLPSASWPATLRLALPVLGLVALFGVALQKDFQEIRRHLARRPLDQTWVQVLERQGLQQDDLIAAEQPEKLYRYFGRVDFFLRLYDYERYVYQTPDGPRHIYSGALMVRNRADFERFVEAAHPGRRLWVAGRRVQTLKLLNDIDPSLAAALRASATRYVETDDGWVLLRVDLPLTSTGTGQQTRL